MDIDVPELVRTRALSNGAAGRQWLHALPDVLAGLSDRWDLTVGAPFRSGTAGYVAEATDSSGRACVVKVAMPLDMDEHDAFVRSVVAHRIAAGQGCVVVLDADPSVPAMLMERLGPNLAELGYDVDQILATIATTLTTFWRPVDVDHSLPTGADKAQWLAEYVDSTWTELGEPCSRRVIDRAIAYCDRRTVAFDPATAVLVHGDAHGWNTLAVGDGTFKFVDVEGLASEPAHDLSVVMREYNEPLLDGDTARLTRDRANMLADRCGVDPVAVWEWGFIERVSTGLANIRELGATQGTSFLEVARRCL
ncbi:MAG: aminoglycoside phosphotransferase family protein [Ilumatobacter sp.]|uniref:aminoglycoside phosphotransferase family protein n=1 Tax=Ilumatobacter sp. TaxID=1967498 RepID=UPI0032969A2A